MWPGDAWSTVTAGSLASEPACRSRNQSSYSCTRAPSLHPGACARCTVSDTKRYICSTALAAVSPSIRQAPETNSLTSRTSFSKHLLSTDCVPGNRLETRVRVLITGLTSQWWWRQRKYPTWRCPQSECWIQAGASEPWSEGTFQKVRG